MATTNATVTVIGGVDTHKHTHYAAAVDDRGRLLGHREFSATDDGYRTLQSWLRGLRQLHAIGVESTGSFGAALARALTKAGEHVIEVNRPNRLARRMDGKSDRLDAEQIARAVLGQTSTAIPKAKTGVVEVIRTLRVTRSSAVKARTQAFNTLFGVMIGAPSPLRDELIVLSKRTLVNRCLRLRPETEDLLSLTSDTERLLTAGVKTALRDLARRWKTLDEEVTSLNKQLETLVRAAAPALVELHGVGVEVAGQFLVTAGDNTDRIRNEAAFAKLCGVAPQPASSGRTAGRHRLSRGGDHAANSALHIVAIVRIRHHQATRDYVERRPGEGLTKREIIRCLKRYIAREICPSHQPPRPGRPSATHQSFAPLDEHRSIERFHRTLADGWAYARFYDSEAQRRAALPNWLHFYNHHRAHSAIGGQPPISRLTNVPGHHNWPSKITTQPSRTTTPGLDRHQPVATQVFISGPASPERSAKSQPDGNHVLERVKARRCTTTPHAGPMSRPAIARGVNGSGVRSTAMVTTLAVTQPATYAL